MDDADRREAPRGSGLSDQEKAAALDEHTAAFVIEWLDRVEEWFLTEGQMHPELAKGLREIFDARREMGE